MNSHSDTTAYSAARERYRHMDDHALIEAQDAIDAADDAIADGSATDAQRELATGPTRAAFDDQWASQCAQQPSYPPDHEYHDYGPGSGFVDTCTASQQATIDRIRLAEDAARTAVRTDDDAAGW